MATTLIKQDRVESIDVGRLSARSGDLHVCAECKYAQLFAVQPRALCTCEGSASAGKVLFAGQPACADMSPREGEELVLSMCTPGVKVTHACFIGAGSRTH
jgi:hypothetical protein